MHEVLDVAIDAGRDDFLGKLDVRAMEAFAIARFLMEDPDQIDDSVAAVDEASQACTIVHVCIDEIDAR
jgi:hypothetical protein